MKTALLWLRWLVTQAVSFVLTIFGIPVCAYLAWQGDWACFGDRWHWAHKYAWIFDNDDDGICPHWYRVLHSNWSINRCTFYWTAFRNPVSNLRHVKYVSVPGGPYKLYTFKHWYFHFGYQPNTGYPVISPGSL